MHVWTYQTNINNILKNKINAKEITTHSMQICIFMTIKKYKDRSFMLCLPYKKIELEVFHWSWCHVIC
jgi:hypothetical protein